MCGLCDYRVQLWEGHLWNQQETTILETPHTRAVQATEASRSNFRTVSGHAKASKGLLEDSKVMTSQVSPASLLDKGTFRFD